MGLWARLLTTILIIINYKSYTQFIKSEAKRFGFMSCGISQAGFLDKEALD
jgi:epoxyqueuosine reductase